MAAAEYINIRRPRPQLVRYASPGASPVTPKIAHRSGDAGTLLLKGAAPNASLDKAHKEAPEGRETPLAHGPRARSQTATISR